MGKYPDKVTQTRFGQRLHGVGIVWEKPECVDVDHYELFISSREVDPTQIEAFCRGEVDFAKKFVFDNTIHSAIDNKTPMFNRMLYSVFAVDKAGDYVDVPFTVDDSRSLNLKSPKYIAVEEGPWGTKGPKQIAVEEGPVGMTASSLREAILAKKSSEKAAEGPWVLLEYSEGKFLMTICSDTMQLSDGSWFFPKPFEIRRFLYTLSENKISGEIMNDLPIYFLEKTHINGENFNISLHLPAVSSMMSGGKELLTVELYGCKISLISFNYDENTCQKVYDFTAQRYLVKNFDGTIKDEVRKLIKAEVPPPQPPTSTTTAKAAETVFCPSCGTCMTKGMATCPSCGRESKEII